MQSEAEAVRCLVTRRKSRRWYYEWKIWWKPTEIFSFSFFLFFSAFQLMNERTFEAYRNDSDELAIHANDCKLRCLFDKGSWQFCREIPKTIAAKANKEWTHDNEHLPQWLTRNEDRSRVFLRPTKWACAFWKLVENKIIRPFWPQNRSKHFNADFGCTKNRDATEYFGCNWIDAFLIGILTQRCSHVDGRRRKGTKFMCVTDSSVVQPAEVGCARRGMP